MPRAYDGSETTGFMSPARDHVDPALDLRERLGLRSPGRYLVRVSGEGLADRGVRDGDLLVVDAAARPWPDSVVVSVSGDETLLAVAEVSDGRLKLRWRGGDLGDGTEVWAVAVALVRERL